jgi:hypothetical protein
MRIKQHSIVYDTHPYTSLSSRKVQSIRDYDPTNHHGHMTSKHMAARKG